MEAASYPRARRRGPTWKAPVALLLYGVAAVVAWSLVTGSVPIVAEEGPAVAPAPTQAAPPDEGLALTTLAERAGRSVVTVGASAGFVAWTTNGLSLVLTARPVGGWQTGEARSVVVSAGSARHEGTLVRADPQIGLGLVRVRADLGRPLWQTRAPAPVAAGDRLAIATPDGPVLFAATDARRAAIWGAPAGLRPGAPVLDDEGRLVGVTTGGRVVPIDRACGPIRRC